MNRRIMKITTGKNAAPLGRVAPHEGEEKCHHQSCAQLLSKSYNKFPTTTSFFLVPIRQARARSGRICDDGGNTSRQRVEARE